MCTIQAYKWKFKLEEEEPNPNLDWQLSLIKERRYRNKGSWLSLKEIISQV